MTNKEKHSLIFKDGVLIENSTLTQNLHCVIKNDEVTLTVPKDAVIATPIYLLFLTSKNQATLSLRTKIILQAQSSAIFVAEHFSENAKDYTNNFTVELVTESNARMHYFKIQREDLSASHLSKMFIEQKHASVVKTFFLSQGSLNAADHVQVNLQSEGAECDLRGLYTLAHDKQKIAYFIEAIHKAAHTQSGMFFKGILARKSHAIFNGKVCVNANIHNVNAEQANHNLLLSPEAEIETKPELEIYAEDVKCRHGATVGQLDEETLFYLRSRGITKEIAKKILTQAFANETFNTIENVFLKEYLQQQVCHYEN